MLTLQKQPWYALRHWRHASATLVIGVLLALPVDVAFTQKSRAADWINAPSYYTHDPQTGERVNQYAPIPKVYVFQRSDYMKSGYRHNRSSLRGGDGSFDIIHLVEEWGRPVRPYGEWEFPYRPFSVPYNQWGPPPPVNVFPGGGWGGPGWGGAPGWGWGGGPGWDFGTWGGFYGPNGWGGGVPPFPHPRWTDPRWNDNGQQFNDPSWPGRPRQPRIPAMVPYAPPEEAVEAPPAHDASAARTTTVVPAARTQTVSPPVNPAYLPARQRHALGPISP